MNNLSTSPACLELRFLTLMRKPCTGAMLPYLHIRLCLQRCHLEFSFIIGLIGSILRTFFGFKNFGGELFLLKKLAQIVFSVLSSSSICETNFRDYEYIMDKRRLRLRPELAEKLVFVYCNKRMKLRV